MRNWTKLYNRYEKMYDAKKEKSEVGMEDKYSELEFKTMVVGMESDIKTGVTQSKDIVRTLVNKQEKYKYSVAQAKVIKERLEYLYGSNYSIKEIRKGDSGEFWKDIEVYKKDLATSGLPADKAGKIISEVFFGSK